MYMQVRQFWPPTKHKLLYANFIIYGIILVLVFTFHRELAWARKTLSGYLVSGNIPPSADRQLISEAIKRRQQGQDVNSIQPLLERAVQIEPYSEAQVLLGYCHISNGDYDKALVCYEKYRSANPSYAGLYKDIIEILEKKHDHKAIEQLLTEGIKNFRRRVELYKPYYDPNLPDAFNYKAFTVYKDAKEGLKFLEDMQEQLKVHE
jgi:tetratricopeptide (TPR) repeat protein